jgi:hypothetical protein
MKTNINYRAFFAGSSSEPSQKLWFASNRMSFQNLHWVHCFNSPLWKSVHFLKNHSCIEFLLVRNTTNPLLNGRERFIGAVILCLYSNLRRLLFHPTAMSLRQYLCSIGLVGQKVPIDRQNQNKARFGLSYTALCLLNKRALWHFPLSELTESSDGAISIGCWLVIGIGSESFSISRSGIIERFDILTFSEYLYFAGIPGGRKRYFQFQTNNC